MYLVADTGQDSFLEARFRLRFRVEAAERLSLGRRDYPAGSAIGPQPGLAPLLEKAASNSHSTSVGRPRRRRGSRLDPRLAVLQT